ncbi:MAG: FprA family A-type flavoprotein [Deltaproteobacteria bacterium]|nr:MAG: FprA family A-type flavoprotein [Deltaproteobacteria bacterium]
MRKVAIVYTTQTGETEKMAESIADGVRAAGGEATLMKMAEVTDPSILNDFDAIALGSPTQEAKEIPAAAEFMERLAASGVTGKYCNAFGSYGWSGEAPYHLALKAERECGMKMIGEPLKAQQGIRDTDLDVCRAFGMKMVFGE